MNRVEMIFFNKECMCNLNFIRTMMVIVGCLVYAIGYYHRNSTSVLLIPMAQTLNVSESKLGVLSSTYFWSYAVIQPFVGSLSDLFDTSYIVSSSLILTSIGSLGCAFSRNYILTCFLRFLVGFGCGCLYVPICRTYAQWFSPRIFPYIQSTVVAFGGLGGLLAQGPLGKLKTKESWPIAFYIGSSISFFLSFFTFNFLKGTPPKEETNESDTKNERKMNFKDSMIQLFSNVKKCVTFRDFWFLSIWKFLTPSTYSNVSSTWGGSYLKNGLHFTQEKSANYISMTSFAWTVGAPFLSLVSNWTHTRKWCLFVCTLIATMSTFVFSFVIGVVENSVVNLNALILAMLFIFALNSGASLTIAAITYKEMLAKELVGTLMGCGNFFFMIGTSIEMDVTALVVAKYEKNSDDSIPLAAFRYGLWLLSGISCGISLVFILLLKDTYKKAIVDCKDEKKKKEDPNSIETPMIDDHENENHNEI